MNEATLHAIRGALMRLGVQAPITLLARQPRGWIVGVGSRTFHTDQHGGKAIELNLSVTIRQS